jgi:N-terminal domain of galactosyltransferase
MERETDPWEQRILTHYHWGSVLIERRMFEAVGGYCTEYVGWGCEDDDLLIKLNSQWQTVEAWRTGTAISCLHFEHPRPYGGADLTPNLAILNRRRAMGPEAMIRADVQAAAVATA